MSKKKGCLFHEVIYRWLTEQLLWFYNEVRISDQEKARDDGDTNDGQGCNNRALFKGFLQASCPWKMLESKISCNQQGDDRTLLRSPALQWKLPRWEKEEKKKKQQNLIYSHTTRLLAFGSWLDKESQEPRVMPWMVTQAHLQKWRQI